MASDGDNPWAPAIQQIQLISKVWVLTEGFLTSWVLKSNRVSNLNLLIQFNLYVFITKLRLTTWLHSWNPKAHVSSHQKLLAQGSSPAQVWAQDTATAFRHLRKLCEDTRQTTDPEQVKSLTYEECWVDVISCSPCPSPLCNYLCVATVSCFHLFS